MPYRFFTIPIRNDAEATEALNQFLNAHRIVKETMELVQDGANSVWVVAVSYLDADGRPQPVSDKKSKIDYREVLSEPDFQIYAKLRVLRKSLAEQAGVPTYALFDSKLLWRNSETKNLY